MDIDTFTSTETSVDEQAFLNWLTSNDSTVHPSIKLHDFGSMGRGLIATEDITSDTILFSIPRKLLLNTSTSNLSNLLPSEIWSTLEGWTPLILSLMYETLRSTEVAEGEEVAEKKELNWKPYLNLLPTSFDSLMYWSEEELSELSGSMVLNKIGKEEAEESYTNLILPILKSFPEIFGIEGEKEYSLELFHRMGSLILSRSFHVESGIAKDEDEDSDDEEEEEREDVGDVAMVPLADILNAKSGHDNARLFYEPNHLNMVSTSFIPANTQIYNTYADPPNSDLLRRYGHVDDVNEEDLVEIGLETLVDLMGEGENGMGEEEREERAKFGLENEGEDTFSLTTSHTIPDELISFIRLCLLSPADYAKQAAKERMPRPKLDAESAKVALKMFGERLADYDTSIEEDEALLLDESLPPRKRMAVVVRLSEKRILHFTREEIKKMEFEIEPPVVESSPQKRGRDDNGGGGGGKKSRR